MSLLIDTYNCLHAGLAMGGPFTDLSVRKLCQWIVQSPSRQKTTLVIDGRPKPDEPSENEFPDLHLAYSGAGIKADTIIAQMVQRSTARKNITVVTNDRAVAANARRQGAHAQSCETFLTMLLTGHLVGRKLAQTRLPETKVKGVADQAQTDHWLKQFNLQAQKDQNNKPETPTGIDDDELRKLMGF